MSAPLETLARLPGLLDHLAVAIAAGSTEETILYASRSDANGGLFTDNPLSGSGSNLQAQREPAHRSEARAAPPLLPFQPGRRLFVVAGRSLARAFFSPRPSGARESRCVRGCPRAGCSHVGVQLGCKVAVEVGRGAALQNVGDPGVTLERLETQVPDAGRKPRRRDIGELLGPRSR